MNPHVASFMYYPVKGMRGFQSAVLAIDHTRGVVESRRFAFKKSADVPDTWSPKSRFHVAANTEKLPAITPAFFRSDRGGKVIDERVLDHVAACNIGNELHILDTQGEWNCTDTDPCKYGPSVSFLNLNSLRAFSKELGVHISPERFRMDVTLDGLRSFEELSWVDKNTRRTFTVGTVRFRVLDVCTRCPAVNANPETGIADIDLKEKLTTFMESRGYISPTKNTSCVMGILATPLSSGTLLLGDTLTLSE